MSACFSCKIVLIAATQCCIRLRVGNTAIFLYHSAYSINIFCTILWGINLYVGIIFPQCWDLQYSVTKNRFNFCPHSLTFRLPSLFLLTPTIKPTVENNYGRNTEIRSHTAAGKCSATDLVSLRIYYTNKQACKMFMNSFHLSGRWKLISRLKMYGLRPCFNCFATCETSQHASRLGRVQTGC